MQYQTVPIICYKLVNTDSDETIRFEPHEFEKADEALNFKRKHVGGNWELIAVIDA